MTSAMDPQFSGKVLASLQEEGIENYSAGSKAHFSHPNDGSDGGQIAISEDSSAKLLDNNHEKYGVTDDTYAPNHNPFMDTTASTFHGEALAAVFGPTERQRFSSATEISQRPEVVSPDSPHKFFTFSPISRPGTPVQSPSRLHWNQIRNAIIPGSQNHSRSATDSTVNTVDAESSTKPQASTPKAFRLPRRNFRQVVNATRDLSQEELGRFETDIYRACYKARFGEVRGRFEKEVQLGYLPFMSPGSISIPNSASSQPFKSNQETPERTKPSVSQLYHTLVRYASNPRSIEAVPRLPYESEVLSVLAIPFLSDDTGSTEERWTAIESFEIAVGSWQAPSKQREVDRILWCCKVALIPASLLRTRIIATLSTLIFSSKPLDGATVPAFQNVLHGLQRLLYSINQDLPSSSNDSTIVRELVAYVSDGGCGNLTRDAIEEQYGAKWSHADTEKSIRLHIVAETLTRCMENDTDNFKRWSLNEIYKTFWVPSEGTRTTLSDKITVQKLGHFLRAAVVLLRPGNNELVDKNVFEHDCIRILPFLKRNLLGEIYNLPPPSSVVDSCTLAVELLLQFLSSQRIDNRQIVTEMLCQWCKQANEHRGSLSLGLQFLVEGSNWQYLFSIVFAITSGLPEKERNEMLAVIIPGIYSRLTIQMNGQILPEIRPLLNLLAENSPRLFYKPVFALAGAMKDFTLVGQLANVVTVANHIPQFWISDSEMIAIAIMSDPSSQPKTSQNQQTSWGKTRLGQSFILVELILYVRKLRQNKEDSDQSFDSLQSDALRFVTGLEARLALLMEAKEKIVLVPMSQRLLISVLLLEIRLFTRSLKPIPWLSTVVSWVNQSYVGASLGSTSEVVSRETVDEVKESFERMRNLYKMCFENSSSQRTSDIIRLSSISLQQQSDSDVAEEAENRIHAISSFSNAPAAMLRLLVAVYALMTPDDHRALSHVLWEQFLDETDMQIVAPASFLLTVALEKLNLEIAEFIYNELTSSVASVKRMAIKRVMVLFGWRSQLLSQTYLSDKVHRRPFMFAREPLAFVSVDAGSGVYAAESSDEEHATVAGISLPSDLRKRLIEIGWDDKVRPRDSRVEKLRTPFSALSLNQLLDQSNLSKDNTVKGESASSPLIRRKSSSSSEHNSGHKHRPVFVPALVSLFVNLAKLTLDPNPFIAGSAREAVHIMLRDDPSTICRPPMEELSSNNLQIASVIVTLRNFLHVHRSLPPPASHHIFGYLCGFLKYVSREPHHEDSLQKFAYTVPVLANLVSQVYNLSIRDIRRTKLEIFVFPQGSIWFPSTAPETPMFPRYPAAERRGNDYSRQLEYLCMIRTAQNLLLLNMLKQKPKELHIARRRLMDLQLPEDPIGSELGFAVFLPSRRYRSHNTQFQQVSLALSRTYLLLLSQTFRAMPRNFNNRSELKNLFDSLNRILLPHGNDIGIVAHALIACMVAMTRFKRIIAAGGGFSMFMPSLLKVYAEAEKNAGIQHAIQYASSRFYAVHEENYLYQCLDTASKLLVSFNDSGDKDWFAGQMSSFFSSLKTSPQPTLDIAGIFDTNKAEEKELLVASAVTDDLPLTTAAETARGEQMKKILVAGQFEDKLLRPDDLLKLCLTVIAYNPTVTRAYNFLALLRRIVPYFYEASKSSRDILREGIGALGQALFPKAARQKILEPTQARQANQTLSEDIPKDVKNIFDDNLAPCDEIAMRREYLELVAEYVQVAQDLRPSTVKLAIDLLTALLKDSGRQKPELESAILKDLAGSSLSQPTVNQKYALSLLRELAPIIRVFALKADCSGAIDSITKLLQRPDIGGNINFVGFVTHEILSPLLEACEDAASENLLFKLPMRSSVVSLLVQIASLEYSDIASILEKRNASPGFLAGIVLPFCMMVPTTVQTETESQFNQARALRHGVTFVRIVAYVMEACQTKSDSDVGGLSGTQGVTRKNSQNKRSGLAARVTLATNVMSLQIIKVLVLRAAADISVGLKGIWTRIAHFLKDLLADGNAKFALLKNISPLPSPYLSPLRGSNPTSPLFRRSSSLEPLSVPQTKRPRVVDYLTWSILEFLCRSPSPLNLQMRLWMQEKIHDLDGHLKSLDLPGTPFPQQRHSRMSSIFVRPRGSSTSLDILHASSSQLSDVPNDLSLTTSAPSSGRAGLHIHFTPTTSTPASQRQSIHPSMSTPARERDKSPVPPPNKNRDTLASSKLLAIALERIRFVQIYMGYDQLLPIEGQMDDTDWAKHKPWTMSSALLAMAEEMKLLMNEFPECFFEVVERDSTDIMEGETDIFPEVELY